MSSGNSYDAVLIRLKAVSSFGPATFPSKRFPSSVSLPLFSQETCPPSQCSYVVELPPHHSLPDLCRDLAALETSRCGACRRACLLAPTSSEGLRQTGGQKKGGSLEAPMKPSNCKHELSVTLCFGHARVPIPRGALSSSRSGFARVK